MPFVVRELLVSMGFHAVAELPFTQFFLMVVVRPFLVRFVQVVRTALVLPADLWIDRGLQGLLQNPIVAIPIRTLYILDQTTFVLNLVTCPLLCLALGIILRLFSTTIRRV